jgi:hypothetical protein
MTELRKINRADAKRLPEALIMKSQLSFTRKANWLRTHLHRRAISPAAVPGDGNRYHEAGWHGQGRHRGSAVHEALNVPDQIRRLVSK